MILALVLATAVSTDPLQSAFRAAHDDYSVQLTDKFAQTSANSSVIGKSFRFVGSLSNGQALATAPGPYYSYDDGKLRLIFYPKEHYAGPGLIDGPKYMVGIIGGSRKPSRSYNGTNAFGVSARVLVEKLEGNGLAMLERPEGDVSPYMSEFSLSPSLAARLPSPPKDTYWVEVALPGPQARELAQDARLVVEGTITALENGKLSICKGMYGGPRVGNPREVYGSECWIGAKVSRIAFVRRSTGQVLKEWVIAQP